MVPMEDAFIQAILASPNDAAARLVYADWLEEQGDPRAAFLRADVALAATSAGEQYRQARLKLRETALGIERGWLALMSRVPILCCGDQFQQRCPKRWEKLQPTGDNTVRFCQACQRKVFFCTDVHLAQRHRDQGECVALTPRLRHEVIEAIRNREPGPHDIILDGFDFNHSRFLNETTE
jgi:uncharacterized protein (TIGR02996 family)